MSKTPLTLVASLDVEEEGLFRESYSLLPPSVENVSQLSRLRPLLDLGLRATLFCAYPVFHDKKALQTLETMLKTGQIELGAHLHHWNTPPIVLQGESVQKVPSQEVALPIFRAKLESVLVAAKESIGIRPHSFRMGRWDLHKQHWALLADAGIEADASIRPLHHTSPDHFTAPANPYLVQCGNRSIFELPLTVTPLFPALPRLVESLGLQKSFHTWGALALLPVYHPLWAMKAVTSLAVSRGIRTLSLTWHSSELFPGGNPVLPDEAAVEALVQRLYKYLLWLSQKYDVSFMTLAELKQRDMQKVPVLNAKGMADWAV